MARKVIVNEDNVKDWNDSVRRTRSTGATSFAGGIVHQDAMWVRLTEQGPSPEDDDLFLGYKAEEVHREGNVWVHSTGEGEFVFDPDITDSDPYFIKEFVS